MHCGASPVFALATCLLTVCRLVSFSEGLLSEGLREDEWGCQLAEATQCRTGATDLWPRSWLDCL